MPTDNKARFITYRFDKFSKEEMLENSQNFLERMDQRRTVREFSNEPIDQTIIENIIKAASTAPSGAHKQPWTFAVVSDPELKKKIRKLAEQEEYQNYHGRMSEEWLEDLERFRTDWNKPFIEDAPFLIIVFKQAYELDAKDNKHNNYYVNESVGIATGFLLAAIHHAGLYALTHTPSPMNFLTKVLNRPKNERPFLLIPVGHPEKGCKVPDLERKPLSKVMKTYA